MKVNQTKAIVACLGIAAAAAIAGSVSGTVAWFQYNTRTTAEFTGTTAKCTEFLQVRTVKKGVPVDFYEASKPDSGMVAGKTYLVGADDKIYTATSETETDAGVAANHNLVYKAADSGTLYKYDTAWGVDDELYGEWGITVSNNDILTAAGRADNGLKPVTLPGKTQAQAAAATEFFGQPVAGYELYAGTLEKPYHWQQAEAQDYMGFSLQFRVLDINGENTEAFYAQDLYLMDVSVNNASVNPKGDISSALRIHVSDRSAKYALLAPGDASAATVSTTTHGYLDLNHDGNDDTLRDVPNNYSWAAATKLDYGSDKGTQVAYDMNKKMANAASNGLYPVNDGEGHLSGGASFGKTNATAVAENAYLTLDFTIFLEGWQVLDDGVNPASSLWDSATYIGAQFNIGMSFGVTTLD